jgi:integrase
LITRHKAGVRSSLEPWRAIRGAAGLGNERLHDLRHAFATVAASSKMGLPIIGKMLGRSQVARHRATPCERSSEGRFRRRRRQDRRRNERLVGRG